MSYQVLMLLKWDFQIVKILSFFEDVSKFDWHFIIHISINDNFLTAYLNVHNS